MVLTDWDPAQYIVASSTRPEDGEAVLWWIPVSDDRTS